MALWLKAVGEAPLPHPRENHCHLRTRLTQLVPDPSVVERLLKGEASSVDGPQLRALLDEHLTPVLAGTGTVVDLRTNRPGFVDRFLVDRDALPLLS